MSISLIKNRPELYADRGLVHLILKNYTNAESDFSSALKLSPQNHIYYTRRGNARTGLKDYQAAIEDYSLAIHYNSDFVQAYNNRGILYRDISRFDLALDDFSQSIKINPDYPYSYANRALLNALRGKDPTSLLITQDIKRAGALGMDTSELNKAVQKIKSDIETSNQTSTIK